MKTIAEKIMKIPKPDAICFAVILALLTVLVGFLLTGCSAFESKNERELNINIECKKCESHSVILESERDNSEGGQTQGTINQSIGK